MANIACGVKQMKYLDQLRDRLRKPKSLAVWLFICVVLINLFKYAIELVSSLHRLVNRNIPITAENLFLGVYPDWDYFIKQKTADVIFFIFLAIGLWWYEKRNYKKNSKADS